MAYLVKLIKKGVAWPFLRLSSENPFLCCCVFFASCAVRKSHLKGQKSRGGSSRPTDQFPGVSYEPSRGGGGGKQKRILQLLQVHHLYIPGQAHHQSLGTYPSIRLTRAAVIIIHQVSFWDWGRFWPSPVGWRKLDYRREEQDEEEARTKKSFFFFFFHREKDKDRFVYDEKINWKGIFCWAFGGGLLYTEAGCWDRITMQEVKSFALLRTVTIFQPSPGFSWVS